jgi:hypothetical protein
MTNDQTVTEREAVQRERAAFMAGGRAVFEHFRISPETCHRDATWAGTESLARERYPFPTITRPRVLVDESGMGWKYEGGAFWYTLSTRRDLIDWRRDDPSDVKHELTVERVTLWADLLAHPTEEVEA